MLYLGCCSSPRSASGSQLCRVKCLSIKLKKYLAILVDTFFVKGGLNYIVLITTQKIKSSIKDFFSKGNQIRRKLQIWSNLLKKSLMENFIFWAVYFTIFLVYVFMHLRLAVIFILSEKDNFCDIFKKSHIQKMFQNRMGG